MEELQVDSSDWTNRLYWSAWFKSTHNGRIRLHFRCYQWQGHNDCKKISFFVDGSLYFCSNEIKLSSTKIIFILLDFSSNKPVSNPFSSSAHFASSNVACVHPEKAYRKEIASKLMTIDTDLEFEFLNSAFNAPNIRIENYRACSSTILVVHRPTYFDSAQFLIAC